MDRSQYMKKYNKQYREKNQEKLKKQKKQYYQTEQGKKIYKINDWKRLGVIFHDYDLLYDFYINTKLCDMCHCQLDTNTYTRKCIDHDHTITDDENVRNILCHSCNIKRR